jgi:hypothetical protein
MNNLMKDEIQSNTYVQKMTREEVWLRAWTTVAGAVGVKNSSMATSWANICLEEFDKIFPSEK